MEQQMAAPSMARKDALVNSNGRRAPRTTIARRTDWYENRRCWRYWRCRGVLAVDPLAPPQGDPTLLPSAHSHISSLQYLPRLLRRNTRLTGAPCQMPERRTEELTPPLPPDRVHRAQNQRSLFLPPTQAALPTSDPRPHLQFTRPPDANGRRAGRKWESTEDPVAKGRGQNLRAAAEKDRADRECSQKVPLQ